MILTRIHLSLIYKLIKSAINGVLLDNIVRIPLKGLLERTTFAIDVRTLLRDITILTLGEHKEVQVSMKGRSVRKSIFPRIVGFASLGLDETLPWL